MVTLTLVTSEDNQPLRSWTFAATQTVIRIGRAANNEVVLEYDLVSRCHLELLNIGHSHQGELWQLVSHGTNGTFLEGKLVAQRVLPEDCLIQLAHSGPVLRFQLN